MKGILWLRINQLLTIYQRVHINYFSSTTQRIGRNNSAEHNSFIPFNFFLSEKNIIILTKCEHILIYNSEAFWTIRNLFFIFRQMKKKYIYIYINLQFIQQILRHFDWQPFILVFVFLKTFLKKQDRFYYLFQKPVEQPLIVSTILGILYFM